MASEYTDLAAAKTHIGDLLAPALADSDESGGNTVADDAMVLGKVLAVGRTIDARLKAAGYTVPFDDYSGDPEDPTCPAIIHTIATYGLVAQLLLPKMDSSQQYLEYKLLFETELQKLVDGTSEIPEVDPPAAEDAAKGFKALAVQPTFAGVDLTDVDSNGNYRDRMSNY